jgi:LPS sulfotransferase NodH
MKSKYAIVCGSRSGSTYLCDLLKSTNRAGNPKEYFNTEINFDYLSNGKGFVDSIINGTKTENDVFGVKIVGKHQLSRYEKSTLEITHCIHLVRNDSIDQAISRYKAWKTNIWHFNNGITTIPDINYSYEGIKWCLDEIIEENKFYKTLLEGTNYIEISYEDDLLENPSQTIVCILEHLGISINDLPELRSTQIIFRNEQSKQWKLKFIKELKESKQL